MQGSVGEGRNLHLWIPSSCVHHAEVYATCKKIAIANRQWPTRKYVQALPLKVELEEHCIQQRNILEMVQPVS
jgi:hypothetical protein